MRNGESANRPLEVVTRALLHCAQGKVGRANNYTCGSKFTLNIKMAGCGSRKFGCDISDTNRSGEKKKKEKQKTKPKQQQQPNNLPEFWKYNYQNIVGDGSQVLNTQSNL